jgi:hypothetical protein
VRVRRSESGAWELVNARAGAVDARWVTLAEGASSFEPPRNATRPRPVVSKTRFEFRYSPRRTTFFGSFPELADVSCAAPTPTLAQLSAETPSAVPTTPFKNSRLFISLSPF